MRKERADVYHVGVYFRFEPSSNEELMYLQDMEGKILAGTPTNKDGDTRRPNYLEFAVSVMRNFPRQKNLELIVVHPANVSGIRTEPTVKDIDILRILVDTMIKQGNYEIGIILNANPINLSYHFLL